ncbi:MAG: hypothetical protein SCJ97_08675 [Bacillota bacterium]|nr:hypothetical protein [Bacillota bacterium]
MSIMLEAIPTIPIRNPPISLKLYYLTTLPEHLLVQIKISMAVV